MIPANIKTFSTSQLAEINPEAFAALPESYQADSCLQFFRNSRGSLIAAPLNDQVHALGEWEAFYHTGKKQWVSYVPA